jgi:methyl coenzyme M reductase subunit D
MNPLDRMRPGTFKEKEIKLEDVKIIKIHKDEMIINLEANQKDSIQDIKSMLNAKLSFSYRLQYHDSFGQI